MGKSICFHLGHPADLSSRAVLIRNIGVVPPVTIYEATLSGTDETVTVDIDDNLQCEIKLIDTRDGNVGDPTVLKFNTNSNSLRFQSGDVKVLSWEDTSSSSSVSSQSSSSTSSASSLSSSTSSSSTSTSSASSSSSSSSSSTS